MTSFSNNRRTQNNIVCCRLFLVIARNWTPFFNQIMRATIKCLNSRIFNINKIHTRLLTVSDVRYKDGQTPHPVTSYWGHGWIPFVSVIATLLRLLERYRRRIWSTTSVIATNMKACTPFLSTKRRTNLHQNTLLTQSIIHISIHTTTHTFI